MKPDDPELAAAPYEMVRRAVSPNLAGIVSRMTGYREVASGHLRQVEPASLVVPLIISFGGPFAIGLGKPPGDNDLFASFTAGLFAGPVSIDSFGDAYCLQIDFTPLGARRFFRMPMSELTDRMATLEDVLGFSGLALREKLANEPDWPQRFDHAERFIEARLAQADDPSASVAWAYQRLVASGGRAKIAGIAEKIGWSRKHLAQKFAAEVGLAPKMLSRIVRFNRALAMGRDDADCWAGIAAECGYSDQSHLAREFRELAGSPPKSFHASR